MRYPDGGGLTAQGRSRREQVRVETATMFAQDTDAGQVARSLRVSMKSVYQWRRAWRAGGEAALASKGAGGNPCKLDEEQLAQLRAALDAGPAAYGWTQDQLAVLGEALDAGPAAHGWDRDRRWTLARVAALITGLSGASCTPRGVSCLLHRLGFSPQVPAHRAAERDEAKIAQWRDQTWAKTRG